MIRSFRHKGLRRLYEGDSGGVPAAMLRKLRVVIADLDAARRPTDLRLPGYRLHRLKGDMSDYWSVRVTANWRVIFRFDEGPCDVDLVDYH